ncbi:hypothetical protein TRVA0_004S03642 [Trichomonascus vanleenenianus]|uniref:uncharacterized protein n=1 Tax=Trichomonascus vanleenenianus TaxID=2268995 RepID=UPI003EC9DBD0
MKGASKHTILLGCIVGVLSSATQSIGITLQRKSHTLEDCKPPSVPRRPAHRQSLWRIGLSMFLLSNIFGSTVQITTLPLIILSPLQAVGLVFNSICASLVLDEPFTRLSVLGTLLVAGGALLIATFGSIPEPNHDLDGLLVLLHRKPFILWMVLTMALAAVLLFTIRYLSTVKPHDYRTMTIKGTLYGCVSGIFSAHSLLMAKSAVELVLRGIKDHNADDYSRWQTWLIVGAFLFFALSQLYIMNAGLRLCSTSVLYPLIFCVYNVTTIVNGLVYFEQTSKLSGTQIFLVALGTSLVLSGVLCLSMQLDEGVAQSPYHHSSAHAKNASIDNVDPERRPLIPQDNPGYTSFQSLTEGGIPEPNSPNVRTVLAPTGSPKVAGESPTKALELFGFKIGKKHQPQHRVRALSLEQSEILDQLRRSNL